MGNKPTFFLIPQNHKLERLSMLPTVCQACGGPIEPADRRTTDNPNICDACACAWEGEEPAMAMAVQREYGSQGYRDDTSEDRTEEAV
jgi:hypothetical protein